MALVGDHEAPAVAVGIFAAQPREPAAPVETRFAPSRLLKWEGDDRLERVREAGPLTGNPSR
jgi:hypothetical protein